MSFKAGGKGLKRTGGARTAVWRRAQGALWGRALVVGGWSQRILTVHTKRARKTAKKKKTKKTD